MAIQKTFVNAGYLLAVVPFAAHDLGVVMHAGDAEKPRCVWMSAGCAHEHAGEPHAPSPLGSLRTEITTTSTSASVSSTTFAKWL
jgi:hypothetical protein